MPTGRTTPIGIKSGTHPFYTSLPSLDAQFYETFSASGLPRNFESSTLVTSTPGDSDPGSGCHVIGMTARGVGLGKLHVSLRTRYWMLGGLETARMRNKASL